MEPYKTIQQGEHIIEIHQDDDPMSPREGENLGTMVCFHGRYRLPCEADYQAKDYSGWEDMKAAIKRDGAVVVLPVYMLDHSGLAFRTTSFNDWWDSGQVGFIYATAKAIKEYWGCTAITAGIKDKTAKVLEGEVKAYDQFNRGDIWGYVVKKNDEVVDACWGYYGVDTAIEGAREAVA